MSHSTLSAPGEVPGLSEAQSSVLRRHAQSAILDQPVLVSSGRTVNRYFSGQLLTSDAKTLSLTGTAIADIALRLGAESVAGEESGSIAIVSAAALAALQMGRPLSSFFIRKAYKEPFGLLSRPIEPGRRVLIVDDVAGLGNTLLRAVQVTREAGLEPVACMVVVDREDGARKRLSKAGVDLHALFTFQSLNEDRKPSHQEHNS